MQKDQAAPYTARGVGLIRESRRPCLIQQIHQLSIRADGPSCLLGDKTKSTLIYGKSQPVTYIGTVKVGCRQEKR